jgi:hypothetical protein
MHHHYIWQHFHAHGRLHACLPQLEVIVLKEGWVDVLIKKAKAVQRSTREAKGVVQATPNGPSPAEDKTAQCQNQAKRHAWIDSTGC